MIGGRHLDIWVKIDELPSKWIKEAKQLVIETGKEPYLNREQIDRNLTKADVLNDCADELEKILHG